MTAPPRHFDWPALMRLGLRDLRIPARDFWALTPCELIVITGLDAAAPALTRARLRDLAARYPDAPKPHMKGPDHDPDQ